MRRIIILPVALGILLAAFAVAAMVYSNRDPVLIVTGAPFAAISGEARIRRQEVSASRALFRPVKTVTVADGISSDLQVIAVTETAEKPFCVLFPLLFSEAAERYHGEFPEIPIVIFKGRLSGAGNLPSADGVLCIYGTDRSADLYHAGLLAGIIGEIRQNPAESVPAEDSGEEDETAEDPQSVVLLHDASVSADEQEVFSGGVREQYPESGVLFTRTVAGMPETEKISCAVIYGAGTEYIERNTGVPLILFTWLDPAFVSDAVALVFDDSPWALAVPAVRMAVAKQAEGQIPSKPLLVPPKTADNGIFKRLKKPVEKCMKDGGNLPEALTNI